MGRGRAAGYDDQRALILARAAQLFAQRGYAGTSMSQVALACGVSKATLYHYHADKDALLASIAQTHVARLQAVVGAVLARRLAPERRLRALIQALVAEYAGAQHAHRVLTEDVKFLPPAERRRILDKQRAVVQGVAGAVVALRPALQRRALAKPLTMLLFGMVNWLFTWLREDGPLSHADIAPLVADLFVGGLATLQLPRASARAAACDGAVRPQPPL